MKAAFCESHNVFELVVESASESAKVITLNELDAGPHHLMFGDSSFIHSGPREGCELCKRY